MHFPARLERLIDLVQEDRVDFFRRVLGRRLLDPEAGQRAEDRDQHAHRADEEEILVGDVGQKRGEVGAEDDG